MNSPVSLQWLCDHCGVLRVHPSNEGYGSPYSWSCTIFSRGESAFLYGTLFAPSMREAHQIKDYLKLGGYLDVYWERMKGNKVRLVHIDLREKCYLQ